MASPPPVAVADDECNATGPANNAAIINDDILKAGVESDPNANVDVWRSTLEDKNNEGEAKLSKNQLKKKRRWEKLMEIKKRRKTQEKEAKVAKAVAQGRDLEEERRFAAERAKEGAGREKREAIWKKLLQDATSMFQICLDCSFDSQMTPKELNSLASQIRYCYAANKRAEQPCYFSVSSLGGITKQHLQKVTGFPEQWELRGFTCSDQSLEEMHKDRVADLVYLTSDSETTLNELQDDKIYIIGGIVDRNRLKRAAINRASELGIATARLPLERHLQMGSTKVLTCNHVFEILVKYREHKDWKRALLEVLPQRKEAKEINGDQSDDEVAEDKTTNVAADNDEASLDVKPSDDTKATVTAEST